MSDERWVIDATMGYPFCFCPIKGDLDGEYSIITGINIVGAAPPRGGEVVAIVHQDGQAAVDAFYKEHKKAIDKLRGVES